MKLIEIEEQAKHARWIVIDYDSDWTTLKCSRCGFQRYTENRYVPNYCEWCGSKMDNDAEET